MDKYLKRSGLCFSILLIPGLVHAGNSFLEKTKNPAFFNLQQLKNEQTANYDSGVNKHASLVNVNPVINRWHLLNVTDRNGRRTTYNLHAVDTRKKIHLNKARPELSLTEDGKKGISCNIDEEIASTYRKNRKTKSSHISVCKNQLLAVVKQDGFQPGLEKGAEVLRWLGGDLAEDLINKVKTSYFQDKYMVSGETMQASTDATDNRIVSDLPRASIEKSNATK